MAAKLDRLHQIPFHLPETLLIEPAPTAPGNRTTRAGAVVITRRENLARRPAGCRELEKLTNARTIKISMNQASARRESQQKLPISATRYPGPGICDVRMRRDRVQ
jgi:hypothetical protein